MTPTKENEMAGASDRDNGSLADASRGLGEPRANLHDQLARATATLSAALRYVNRLPVPTFGAAGMAIVLHDTLVSLGSTPEPQTTTPSFMAPDIDRVRAFLRERAAWLKYERDHGGCAATLSEMEKECRYIEASIHNGRYLDDGRPSWLVNAITVPDALARGVSQ